MSDALFSPFEVAADAHAGYRLQYLEVFNWGTFDGQVWRLRSGAETALLTGDIGSGKSTVVDAVTTLLLPAHRISYNRAAGATAKERDLRSYVEGHYKSERVEASGRSRPIGLRTGGKTYSVVLGVFVNAGYDEQVTLAQVFQQREATGQPYRFYVLAKRAMTIATDFADFGASLNDLYASAVQNAKNAGPMERIFASGMREYQKLRERRISDPGTLLDGARRAMRASFQREMDVIESSLSFLASVGSVSPYVGLFGTVWGIMHAFVGLSNMQQVTLATVAPGIAEALVATAIGLFAAIPAVVAYNRFAHDIDRVANMLETFIEEFSNILQRNLGAQSASGR